MQSLRGFPVSTEREALIYALRGTRRETGKSPFCRDSPSRSLAQVGAGRRQIQFRGDPWWARLSARV